MSAWHDRVGDLTLFEAPGGAFDRGNDNIAGNLTKIFLKSQMPRGLPGGGMGGFGIDRYIIVENVNLASNRDYNHGTIIRIYVE